MREPRRAREKVTRTLLWICLLLGWLLLILVFTHIDWFLMYLVESNGTTGIVRDFVMLR